MKTLHAQYRLLNATRPHISSCPSHREAIISPGGPLHLAVLDVEGEILDRDITGGLEHAVAQPDNLGVRGEGGRGFSEHTM